MPADGQRAEVIVFRESAFIARVVALTVSVDGKAFASLDNEDKVQAMLPAGSHEFQVQMRSGNPTRLQASLAAGSSTCFRTSASPSTYAKVAIPITLMVTGYAFYLDQVPCPSKEELGKYKDVPVVYQ